jgi:hypothetical protein
MDDLSISLSEALRSGRLQDFIAQEELQGIGPADSRELDEVLSWLITAGKSAGHAAECQQ